MEEALADLFDSCDKSNSCKVPVSVLIEAVKDETRGPDVNPLCIEKGQSILNSIRDTLDPSRSDIQIDKSTWVAAWKNEEETQTNHDQFFRSMESHAVDSSDIFSCSNSSNDSSLNQSKKSYNFSPVLNSSMVVSELEELSELEALRKKNRQLLSSEEALKAQCLMQEEALSQELTERQDQEKKFKDEIAKWAKNYKALYNTVEDLKVSLEACEKEKHTLCNLVSQQNEEKNQLKTKLENLKIEIAASKIEIDELSRMKNDNESQIKLLIAEKIQLTAAFTEQLQDLQERLQRSVAEQDKGNTGLPLAYLHELKEEPEPNNNLMTELKASQLNHSLISGSVKVINFNTTSEHNQMLVSALPECSILEELQAVTSAFQNDPNFDCSFDDSIAHGDTGFAGAEDHEEFLLHRDNEEAMEKKDFRGVLDPKSDVLATVSRNAECLQHVPERLKMLNSGTQTENQWESQPSSSCPASLLDCCTQTENQSQTPPNSSLPASFLNSSFQTANILEVQQSSSLKPAGPTKSHNNKITKSALETSSLLSSTTSKNSSSSFKIPTKLFKGHLSRLTSSTSMESFSKPADSPVPSSFHCSLKWFHVLLFITLNIFILVWGIIILTAAVLEQARETGILDPPYQGSTVVPWLKYLIKPFIRIHHRVGIFHPV